MSTVTRTRSNDWCDLSKPVEILQKTSVRDDAILKALQIGF